MRTVGLLLAILILLFAAEPARAQSSEDIEKVGDLTQILVPLGALTGSLLAKDWQGAKQMTGTFVTSIGTVSMFKVVVEKWRPNVSNPQSFPSGHTAGAFSGAAYLDMRYGWEFGLPAYLIAGFTGYSRVQAQKHFADDVISGMSVSILSAAMWTSPFGEKATIKPIVGTNADGGKSFGVLFNITGPDGHRSKQEQNWDFVAEWRYQWEFGAAWETQNLIQSPSGTGSLFDYSEFTAITNPTMTAQVSVESFLGKDKRHEILFRFFPYERRDSGSFTQATTVGGQVIPANTPWFGAYVQYEIRLRWRYELLPDSNWNLKAGAGVSIQDTSIEIATATQYTKGEDTGIIPIVHLHASVDLSREWRLFAEVDGLAVASDDYFIDATAQVQWRFHPRWDLSFGYRYYATAFDESNLANELQMHRVVLGIGYSW